MGSSGSTLICARGPCAPSSLVGVAVWATQAPSQPLLHTNLQAVYELVRKLEAQAAEVIRSAGGGSTTREHHSCLHVTP